MTTLDTHLLQHPQYPEINVKHQHKCKMVLLPSSTHPATDHRRSGSLTLCCCPTPFGHLHQLTLGSLGKEQGVASTKQKFRARAQACSKAQKKLELELELARNHINVRARAQACSKTYKCLSLSSSLLETI